MAIHRRISLPVFRPPCQVPCGTNIVDPASRLTFWSPSVCLACPRLNEDDLVLAVVRVDGDGRAGADVLRDHRQTTSARRAHLDAHRITSDVHQLAIISGERGRGGGSGSTLAPTRVEWSDAESRGKRQQTASCQGDT
jgi:hypothetical protein